MRILLKWSEKGELMSMQKNGFKNSTYTNSRQGNFGLGLSEFGLSNQQTNILLMSENDAGKICLF